MIDLDGYTFSIERGALLIEGVDFGKRVEVLHIDNKHLLVHRIGFYRKIKGERVYYPAEFVLFAVSGNRILHNIESVPVSQTTTNPTRKRLMAFVKGEK